MIFSCSTFEKQEINTCKKLENYFNLTINCLFSQVLLNFAKNNAE